MIHIPRAPPGEFETRRFGAHADRARGTARRKRRETKSRIDVISDPAIFFPSRGKISARGAHRRVRRADRRVRRFEVARNSQPPRGASPRVASPYPRVSLAIAMAAPPDAGRDPFGSGSTDDGPRVDDGYLADLLSFSVTQLNREPERLKEQGERAVLARRETAQRLRQPNTECTTSSRRSAVLIVSCG